MNKRLLAATALTSTAFLFGPGAAWAQTPWTGAYLGFAFGGAFIGDHVTTDAHGDATLAARSPVASILLGQNWGGPAGFFGVEADFNFITNSFASGMTAGLGVPAGGPASVETTLEHLFTLRARAGVGVGPRTMLFATGGLAVGNPTLSTSYFDMAKVGASGSAQATRVGGVVGGGVEFALSDTLKVRSEALYYLLAPLTANATGTAGYEYSATSNPRGFIVRLGVTAGFN